MTIEVLPNPYETGPVKTISWYTDSRNDVQVTHNLGGWDYEALREIRKMIDAELWSRDESARRLRFDDTIRRRADETV